MPEEPDLGAFSGREVNQGWWSPTRPEESKETTYHD